MELDITTMADLDAAARTLLKEAGNLKIWLLEGEMGSGKTTFVKAVCRQLKVIDEVSSPTFSLINQYQAGDGSNVYHFDFYRLESEEEAQELGLEEYFYSGDLCLLEWPERIPALIPDQYLKINIKFIGENRTIHLTKYGPDQGD